MNQSDISVSFNKTPIFFFAGVFLVSYALLVTCLTGDTGFEGDDWWIFSWPYWNSFPVSIWLYAKELLRPLEGVYWITLFELFGFNKIVFHFLSICLLAGASLLMGACLYNLFPNRRTFVTASVFWAFFLPTVSCLTYVVTTDNSRLSLLIFWASVLSFQNWTKKGCTWRGLLLPVFLYIAAFFTYEAPSLLIFAIPLFVAPIYSGSVKTGSSKNFIIKLTIGLLSAFLIALLSRFMLLKGGAVSHSNLIPPFELILSYFALIPWYLIGILDFSTLDLRSAILGGIAGLFVLIFFIYLEKHGYSGSCQSKEYYYQKKSYVLILSIIIIVLGMAPYQLAGYGSANPSISDTVLAKYGFIQGGYTAWFNYNWSSRIYSSASFGLAILLAFLMTCWNNFGKRLFGYCVGVFFIGLALAFHSSLITDWKEAAEIRNSLCRSLISQVPDVEPRTNILFVDLESYHKRAAVFRGWNGLRDLVRMLYDSRDLGSYYVYRCSLAPPNELHQQAVFYPKGFVSRGIKMESPLPPCSLVVLHRVGADLVLLDNLSSNDGLVSNGIKWVGVSSLTSNTDRILPWSDTGLTPKRLAVNAWTSGLISTLNLSRLNLSYKIRNKWTYTGLYKQKRLIGLK